MRELTLSFIIYSSGYNVGKIDTSIKIMRIILFCENHNFQFKNYLQYLIC